MPFSFSVHTYTHIELTTILHPLQLLSEGACFGTRYLKTWHEWHSPCFLNKHSGHDSEGHRKQNLWEEPSAGLLHGTKTNRLQVVNLWQIYGWGVLKQWKAQLHWLVHYQWVYQWLAKYSDEGFAALICHLRWYGLPVLDCWMDGCREYWN